MAELSTPTRTVTAVSVDGAEHVTHVYNDDESWSPRDAREVIVDLELGLRYVVESPGATVLIVDAFDGVGKFLSTSGEGSGRNHLLELPRRDRDQP